MSAEFTDTQLEMLSQRWLEEPSARLALQMADLHRQRGTVAEVLPVLEQSLEQHPGHVSVQVALGRCRLEAGDSRGAANVLREVVDKDAGHLVANKLLVRAYLAVDDVKSAADRLELYALLNENDPELEALRAAVEGTAAPASTKPGPPPLPASFASSAAGRGSALADLAPPHRRGLSGNLKSNPFESLLAESWQPSLPAFFAVEEAPAVSPPIGLMEGKAEATAAAGDLEPEEEPAIEEAATAGEELQLEVEAEVEELAAVEEAPEDTAADLPLEAVAPLAAEFEAAEEVAAMPEQAGEGSGATTTLGALYLAQGHLADAKTVFEQVLERDPTNPEARAGLEDIARRLGAGAAPAAEPPPSPIAKVAHLQQYLKKIRAAAGRLSA